MIRIRYGVVCLALAGTLTATPASAADPFYDSLLERGRAAYAQADYPTAVHRLRIACFGLLDEPQLLAVGLTYLALAQAHGGDDEGFAATADRLIDVESRFSAYRDARIDSGTRQALELRLAEVVPYERLLGVATFRTAARARRENELRALPPADRRQALEALIATEPDDPDWRLLLAELDLATGDATRAREVLAAQADLRARDVRARCLYGRANAAANACAAALIDLEACGPPASDLGLATDWVRCLSTTADWAGAVALLDTLPAAWRQRKPLRQLDKRARRSLRRAPSTVSSVQDPTPATTGQSPPPAADAATIDTEASQPAATVDAVPNVAPPPSDPPPDERAEPPAPRDPSAALAALRERFRTAGNDQAALNDLFAEATELAGAHPNTDEVHFLSAEIAYRLRRWPDVVRFVRSGGTVTERPALQFYYAIALYETGDRSAAAVALRSCLPRLERTPFVQDYVSKILDGTR